jgi:ribonucleoside-diphosphate reductase alpha chain
MVSVENGVATFDHELLYQTAQLLTRNLDKIVDLSTMPDPKTTKYIEGNRSIGIGVSGLADVFCMMRMPFDSPQAERLNAEIFETIYYAAVRQSVDLAKVNGPFPNFKGSEFSKGRFQFDMWPKEVVEHSGRWDWETLREDMVAHGTRNALLTCCMPTASTSQILGYSECFEPINSIFYVRKVLSGEFVVVHQHLMRELCSRGLWNEDVKKQIIKDRSVQNLAIPQDLKMIYRTAYELKMKPIINLAKSRAPYIDQTQSMNLFGTHDTSFSQISSALTYAHKMGLKTLSYYYKQLSHKTEFIKNAPVVKEAETAYVEQSAIEEDQEVSPMCTMQEGCWSCSA